VQVHGSIGASTRVRTGVVVHENGAPPRRTPAALPAGYGGMNTRQYYMTIDMFSGLGQVNANNSADVRLLGDTVDWLDPNVAEPAILSTC
jgi:hypothetical protein